MKKPDNSIANILAPIVISVPEFRSEAPEAFRRLARAQYETQIEGLLDKVYKGVIADHGSSKPIPRDELFIVHRIATERDERSNLVQSVHTGVTFGYEYSFVDEFPARYEPGAIEAAIKLSSLVYGAPVHLSINGIDLKITSKDKVDRVLDRLQDAIDAETNSRPPTPPEIIEEQRRKSEREKAERLSWARRDLIRAKAIIATTPMEFKNEAAKKKWEKLVTVNNLDPDNAGLIRLAEGVAKIAQLKIAEGERQVHELVEHLDPHISIFKDIAKGATEDNIDRYGQTDRLNRAYVLLMDTWKYGSKVREWRQNMGERIFIDEPVRTREQHRQIRQAKKLGK